MATQKQSNIRTALLSTVALLGMGLPLSSVLLSNPAMAQQMPHQSSSKRHHHNPPKTPANPATPPATPTTPPATPTPPKQPMYMEGYAYSYKYATQPVINGVTLTEGYAGVGFAPVGTYMPGQTINVTDDFGRTIGTYTIVGVNDKTAFDANKLNQVIIGEYDYNATRITANGLSPNAGGKNGLGSESGQVIGIGLEGTNANFNNRTLAVVPHHF
jgi:hypothetical protein